MSPQLKKPSMLAYILPMGLIAIAFVALAVTAGINLNVHFTSASTGWGQTLSGVGGLVVDVMVLLLAASAGILFVRHFLGGILALTLALVFGLYSLTTIVEWGAREFIEKSQLAHVKQSERIKASDKIASGALAERSDVLTWLKGQSTRTDNVKSVRQQSVDAIMTLTAKPIAVDLPSDTVIQHVNADPGAATISNMVSKVTPIEVTAETIRVIKVVAFGVLLIIAKIAGVSIGTALLATLNAQAKAANAARRDDIEDDVADHHLEACAANDTAKMTIPAVLAPLVSRPQLKLVGATGEREMVKRFFGAAAANYGGKDVRADTVYGWYCEWMRSMSADLPITQTMFGRLMTDVGAVRVKRGSWNYYTSIGNPLDDLIAHAA
ncbi:MAG: hypothetical protein ABL901_02750 [Hyphomicrobiaceae bacterium]